MGHILSITSPIGKLVSIHSVFFVQFIVLNLFFRYFTLFMNLLSDCQEAQEVEKESARPRNVAQLALLRTATIQAMSNLLSANIDSGLMHSIGKFIIFKLK